MGVDVEIEEPECPDFVLMNDGKETAERITQDLIKKLKRK